MILIMLASFSPVNMLIGSEKQRNDLVSTDHKKQLGPNHNTQSCTDGDGWKNHVAEKLDEPDSEVNVLLLTRYFVERTGQTWRSKGDRTFGNPYGLSLSIDNNRTSDQRSFVTV